MNIKHGNMEALALKLNPLTNGEGRPYLKILDLAKLFVADAPMKKLKY